MGAAASVATAVTRSIGARFLFDEMPMDDEDTGAAPATVGDEGINALPDRILAHILGFLPAEEAVRTCVLARRWRHLWKSATGLRVLVADGEFLGTVDKVEKFVDCLVSSRKRKRASLDSCDLSVGCDILEHGLEDLSLVSRHLTTLELYNVELCNRFLNFSGCPALENLVFERCDFWKTAKTISFKSLKHLNITGCNFSMSSRTRILAPNMVSLRLESFDGMAPMLDSMQSLVDAYVKIDWLCFDECELRPADCDSCEGNDYQENCYCDTCRNKCVLLKGLSEAVNLTMISDSTKCIFKRDLRLCPTFNKLKTLLLNDYWCVPDDFWALACILEHSPFLEKLTLQLFSKYRQEKVQFEGSVDPTLRYVVSEHLTVQVMCTVVDERILKLLKFLEHMGLGALIISLYDLNGVYEQSPHPYRGESSIWLLNL